MQSHETRRLTPGQNLPRLQSPLSLIVAAGSALAIGGGVVTIVGWSADLPRLTDWGDDGISMFVNTAVCTILCGLALALLIDPRTPRRIVVARYAAAVAGCIGGLTLLQHVTGLNLGIDTLLLTREWGQTAAVSSMRMGPPAATSFTVLGLALVLATGSSEQRRIASALALLPSGIALLSLIGYLFGADQLFVLPRATGIARQTSTILAALGVCTAAAIPEHGLAAALLRRDAGGQVLRRLILAVVAAPVLLGWLQNWGRSSDLYDARFGAALRTLCEIGLLLALVWWTTNGLSRHSQAARMAHSRLGTIVDWSSDAIVSTSLDGVIETWNAGAEQMFGYGADEAIGRPLVMLVPEDREEECEEFRQRVTGGETMANVDSVRRRRNGELIDVSMSISPIRNAGGEVAGVSTIIRDVTEWRKAEKATREREAELKALADSIAQLAWMAHADGDIFWYNRRWYEYTGTDFDSMQGWGWEAVHDPEMLPEVKLLWQHSLETGKPFEMEFQLRGADGKFRWFLTRANPLRDDEGKIVRWFGTNTNIEHAKQIEKQLLQQTHTLELLHQSGIVVGSTLDLDELLQGVTDVATKLSEAEFGAFFYNSMDEQGDAYMLYTLSGAKREDFENLGMPRATPLFEPTFQGEGPIRSDDIAHDPRYGLLAPHNGMPKGHLPVRSYLAVPVVSGTEGVLGGLFFGHSEPGVFTEQSERLVAGIAAQASIAIDKARMFEQLKRAAEDREILLEAERSARAEAERLNVLKDEFLSTLSHELRTPLTAILGWAQLLTMRPATQDELDEGLQTIERNARAQTQLIDDLLDMSRILSGKIRLEVQPTNLGDVVDQAVASVRPSAEAKQIVLRVVVDPHAGPVSGDPARLLQVVWNLLTNAVKFTPKAGTIDVRLGRVNSHVEFTVRDTGIGIKPEFLNQVFERFRQADSSTKRSYGGLGLGLSIVKSLVELHGGSVAVDSAGEGQGAAFTVTLPLAPTSAASRGGRDGQEAISDDLEIRLAGVKVLVVDDDRDTRDLVMRVLRQYEADVTAVDAAADALEQLKINRPDVIVSDIGMPGVDGYEFIKEVRRLSPEEGGATPAISLTAFARSVDRTRSMLAGYQVHVCKPIEPRELAATVSSLAPR